MKKILFTFIALTFMLSAKAQNADTIKGFDVDTVIFTSVEHPPEFPGGEQGFNRYLWKNIRYPGVAVETNKQGKVILSFIVEKDGALTDFKVVHSVSPRLDEEALRVMKKSPKWIPGVQNGQPVRVLYTVPISFTLSTM